MAFERYKTQVLLLHSQQSTLDVLSSGFDDNYAVHCATSGTDALNTLGDTPIHVLVSAQDLPGMSGLEALREAKKRSPHTIGILLAGNDANDGLDALIGDQETIQIVRGSVTAESVLDLVDSATERARQQALEELISDQVANAHQPVGEHIVMETSEYGSSIITDLTERMPVLQPDKNMVAPVATTRGIDMVAPVATTCGIDILVLTKDKEFLATIRDSTGGLHNVHHAVSPQQAENYAHDENIAVLVTDAAMVGSNIEALTRELRVDRPRIVAIVAGRRSDGEMMMDLINRGHVYRFLLKPVSPGRARLAIEASVKHHHEAPDSAFTAKSKVAPPATKPVAKKKQKSSVKKKQKSTATKKQKSTAMNKQKSAAANKQKSTAKKKQKSAATNKQKSTAKKKQKPAAKSAAKPVSAPDTEVTSEPVSEPVRQPETGNGENAPASTPPTASSSPFDGGVGGMFDTDNSFVETMTDIAAALGNTLTDAGAVAGRAQNVLMQTSKLVAGVVRSKVAGVADGSAQKAVLQTSKAVAGVVRSKVAGVADGSAQKAVLQTSKAVAGVVRSAVAQSRSPKTLGIAGGSLALVALVTWVITSWESTPTAGAPAEPAAGQTAAAGASYQILLDTARAARDAGNLITPAGANAVTLYLVALASAPRDPIIEAELDMVVSQILGLAETAILEQSPERASVALAVVRQADPYHARLIFLDTQLAQLEMRASLDQARIAIRELRFEDARQLISEARGIVGDASEDVDRVSLELSVALTQAQVAEALATADERLESGWLLAPPDDNARFYYELALSIDSDNQPAQRGLTTIASKLVLQASAAINRGRLDEADNLLRDARILDASNTELSTSTAALETAREERAAAERQAEAARVAELERQAELARQTEVARLEEIRRQAELDRQAEIERLADLKRQAERARLAEIERLANLERHAELVRQSEIDSLAELERLADIGRQTELETQADLARLAELERREEAARQAAIREAEWHALEQEVAAIAMASAVGVAGSRLIEPGKKTAPIFTATRSSSSRRAPRRTNVAPPVETPSAPAPAPPPPNFSITKNAASAPNASGSNEPVEDEVVSINSLIRTNYVAPKYPRAALLRELSGSVDVGFTVSTNGTVTDVAVLRAERGKTFNRAAIRAVERWRFEPVIENGVAVEKRTVVRLLFNME